MKVVSIQPSMAPDLRRPYPYFIVGEGDDAGQVLRQDFWKGEPNRLVGFQARLDVQQIDLSLGDFLAAPSQAVGMYPVFLGLAGEMYGEVVAISNVTVTDEAS